MCKKIQLFALPFAGGNAHSFDSFIPLLNNSIATIVIEYSGRGQRVSEGYITDYNCFLDDVCAYIQERRDKRYPYALFGYSMGAAFAYEIASGNRLDGPPSYLFYGGRECLSNCKTKPMTDEEFLEHSKLLGGFDHRLVENPRLFRLFKHPLVDDYNIAKQYRFQLGVIPSCDACVFYSNEDTPRKTVEGWSKLSQGKTSFFAFEGNHFFIKQHYAEIADIINRELKEIIE